MGVIRSGGVNCHVAIGGVEGVWSLWAWFKNRPRGTGVYGV